MKVYFDVSQSIDTPGVEAPVCISKKTLKNVFMTHCQCSKMLIFFSYLNLDTFAFSEILLYYMAVGFLPSKLVKKVLFVSSFPGETIFFLLDYNLL